jgi:hypothetical protein
MASAFVSWPNNSLIHADQSTKSFPDRPFEKPSGDGLHSQFYHLPDNPFPPSWAQNHPHKTSKPKGINSLQGLAEIRYTLRKWLKTHPLDFLCNRRKRQGL